jgi:ribose-phosphate pyrophosphokinase
VERLQQAPIKQVVITDTIPLRRDRAIEKIKVLSVAPLLGEAIKRIHRNESVSRLFD